MNSRSVTLWYLNGCHATFYLHDPNKKAIETVVFTDKAYLAYKQLDFLNIARPAVHYLIHLTSIQLQNNRLAALPIELWHLPNLTQLNLGNNQLTTVPIELGLLHHLRELYLHNNQITSIPPQIGKLTNLTMLDLTNNQLRFLPGELTSMVLQNLWVDQNPYIVETEQRLSFNSLRGICLQLIGVTCLKDEESRLIIEETSLQLPMLKQVLIDELLLTKCAVCSTHLFQNELHLYKYDNNNYPLLYQTCSQNCLIKLSST